MFIGEITPALTREGEFIAELLPDDDDYLAQCHDLDKLDSSEIALRSLSLLFSKKLITSPPNGELPLLKVMDLVTRDAQRPQLFRVKRGVTAVRMSDEGVINWVFNKDQAFAETSVYPEVWPTP